jgi:hypothetical protein
VRKTSQLIIVSPDSRIFPDGYTFPKKYPLLIRGSWHNVARDSSYSAADVAPRSRGVSHYSPIALPTPARECTSLLNFERTVEQFTYTMQSPIVA